MQLTRVVQDEEERALLRHLRALADQLAAYGIAVNPAARNGADGLEDYECIDFHEEKRLAGYDIKMYEPPTRFTPRKRKREGASGSDVLDAVAEAEANMKETEQPAPSSRRTRGKATTGGTKGGGTGGKGRRGGKK